MPAQCLLLTTLTCIIYTATSWDLSLLKISPFYHASSIAVYKNRAFLTLPRSSCFNNLTNPTLIEVPWLTVHHRYSLFRPKVYPIHRDQSWGHCGDVQDAVSVDVETRRAKMWVLDKGNKECPAKIVIFNLHYNNIVQSCRLAGVDNEKLSFLVVDPDSDEFGTRAYIGGLEDRIVVFSTRHAKLWTWKFPKDGGSHAPISTARLALSKTDPILYISGDTESSSLYALNLTQLRNFDVASFYVVLMKEYLQGVPINCCTAETSLEINVTFVGHKLGPSAGMATDIKGGLIYYLIRDYAILRWDTSKPLRAEYHAVLAQSYKTLPYVPHIFTGPQNGIWALVDPSSPEACDRKKNETILVVPEEIPTLKTRVVELSQYKRAYL